MARKIDKLKTNRVRTNHRFRIVNNQCVFDTEIAMVVKANSLYLGLTLAEAILLHDLLGKKIEAIEERLGKE